MFLAGKATIPPALAKAREIATASRSSKGVLLDAKKNDKGTEGELYIYAPIGESFWSDGVTAQQVVEKLDALKGVKKLSVRINSEGGEIWAGKAIENAIRRFEADEKVTYVDGLAASAATFIAMATPRVVSAANATWMVHEIATVAAGRASDLRAAADLIDKENGTVAETYARRTGRPAAGEPAAEHVRERAALLGAEIRGTLDVVRIAGRLSTRR